MTFTLKPNPGLYAKLAAQWEAEEVQRQQDAARRIHMDWSTYWFLILLMIIMIVLQLSVCTYKLYISKRRQARRELYAQEYKDVENAVEDVITIVWAEDEKVGLATSNEPNEPPMKI